MRSDAPRTETFPFNLPALAGLEELRFDRPITYFVGENGSGKSTLLEAIAWGIGAATVGGEDLDRNGEMGHARALSNALKFRWRKKTGRGFFMNAEDFINHGKRIRRMSEEFREMEAEYDRNYEETPSAEGMRIAKDAARGQRLSLERQYREGFSDVSHGESFLKFFQTRIAPGGLYLLDEPETPLSPLRQLAFLSLLKRMVAEECQMIVATHSPILMAYPDARIYSFDRSPLAAIPYEEVERVSLMRDFLANPNAFLRRL
jgi:predicted ATPase